MSESLAHVPADDSPVPAGPATVPMGARPWQGPDRIVLRVPFGCMTLSAVFPVVVLAAIGVAFFFFEMQGRFQPAEFFFVLLAPTVIMAWSCWFFSRQYVLPRVTFDRQTEMLTLGWRGLRGRRSLSSILGVQVMQTRKQFGGPELNIPAMTLYQVNLILDDPAERRLNVMTCAAVTARSTAKTVADFLGVPVLDSAAGPSAAPADAKAEATAIVATWSAVPSPVVVEPRPDLLLIRPRLLTGPLGRQWMKFTPVLVLLVVLLVFNGHADMSTLALLIPLAGFGLILPLGLLQLQAHRARFDRARGELTVWRPGGRPAPRPLESVKAVEVVEGPENRLNLLLDDPNEPQLTVINDADAALVRRAAERVASFLGVPLHGANRPAPAAPQTGRPEKAVNPLELLSRTPLPPGGATIHGSAHVVQKGDILLLRRRSGLTWLRLIPSLLTTGFELYILWLVFFGPAGQAGLATSAAIVLLFGAMSQVAALRPMFLYRDHFDRRTGLLTLGCFALKGKHPLAKVLAVQLIPGGLVDKNPGSFGRGGEHVAYQLNLVLADAYQDRLNLTDDSDVKWTRQAGQQVADFLGVPVIDQIAEED